jgi:signal transduction histidine kinase
MKAEEFYLDPDEPERLYQRTKQEGVVKNYEVELKRKGGIPYWGRLDCKMMQYQGQPVLMASMLDITEQKKAADAFQTLLENTRKVSEMKTNIITFASHELKTPLIPIIGWTDFIRSAMEKGEDLNKTIKPENLEAILRSADRLHNIINDFLDVGRIDSSHLELELDWIDLHDVIDNAIQAVAYQAETTKITIHNEIGELNLYADQGRLEQVFVNLLSNSVKYSPPQTEIWVRAGMARNSAGITVQDQGYGFSSEELEDVMQPFSKSFLKSKGDHVFSGTGVGLYICKGIIERHGGTITITSPGVNQGTTVRITLPLR